MTCSICDYVGSETHLHHIIPVANGGTDAESNLIRLCVPCHQKAHSASFGGDSGVIKAGIKKTKEKWRDATDWLGANEVELHKLLMDFYQEEDTSVITDLLYYNAIKANDLHTWLKFGKGMLRRPFGELPEMLHSFYEQNKDNYTLDLNGDFSKFGR